MAVRSCFILSGKIKKMANKYPKKPKHPVQKAAARARISMFSILTEIKASVTTTRGCYGLGSGPDSSVIG
jgi:hypothetical protein